MKWGRILVAAAALAGGALLLADRFPGSATAAGPRIGMAVFLLMLGLLVLSLGAAPWVLRKTTNAEDYAGGCPVGARCSCGHFNLKPRRVCRECGTAMVYPVS